MQASSQSKQESILNPKSIWLGLSESTRSLRPYPSLATIWDLVARTAFTQLNYSPLLLIGTAIAMTLTYLVPPAGLILAILLGNGLVAIASLLAWLLMAVAYLQIEQAVFRITGFRDKTSCRSEALGNGQ